MTSFFSLPQRDRLLDYVKDIVKKKTISPVATETKDQTLGKRTAGSLEDLKDNLYLQKKAAEIITAPVRKATGNVYEEKKQQAKSFLESVINSAKKRADAKINEIFPSTTIRYDFTGKPVVSPTPTQEQITPAPTKKVAKPTPTIMPIEKVQAAEKTATDTARNPAIKRFTIVPEVHSAIQTAADTFGVPQSLLYDIALQENSFDPKRVNTAPDAVDATGKPLNPTGLFQFTDSTWKTVLNYEAMPGSSLRLPNHDRTDPLTNAMAAAYLIKFGQLGRWDASKNVWGQYYTDEELKQFYAQRK